MSHLFLILFSKYNELIIIFIALKVDVACRAYYQQQYDLSASLAHRYSQKSRLGMTCVIDEDDDYCDDDDEEDDDNNQDVDEIDYDTDDIRLGERTPFISGHGRRSIVVRSDNNDDDDGEDDSGVSPKEV